MTTTCPRCAEDVPVGAARCPACDSPLASGGALQPISSPTPAAATGSDFRLLDERGVRVTSSTITVGGATYAVRGISGVVVKQALSRRTLLTWAAVAIPTLWFGSALLSLGPRDFVALFTDTLALAAVVLVPPVVGAAVCLQRSIRHPAEKWVVEVLTPAGGQTLLEVEEAAWAQRVADAVNRAVRGVGA